MALLLMYKRNHFQSFEREIKNIFSQIASLKMFAFLFFL